MSALAVAVEARKPSGISPLTVASGVPERVTVTSLETPPFGVTTYPSHTGRELPGMVVTVKACPAEDVTSKEAAKGTPGSYSLLARLSVGGVKPTTSAEATARVPIITLRRSPLSWISYLAALAGSRLIFATAGMGDAQSITRKTSPGAKVAGTLINFNITSPVNALSFSAGTAEVASATSKLAIELPAEKSKPASASAPFTNCTSLSAATLTDMFPEKASFFLT